MRVSHPTGKLNGIVSLPLSKSIYNRALILKRLFYPNLEIQDGPDSNDTLLLVGILKDVDSGKNSLQAGDAGTVLRFVLPYLCIRGGNYTVHGTQRLMDRPNQALIQTLNEIGFDVEVHRESKATSINVISAGIQSIQSFKWKIDASESSQFASALAMIAPACKESVEIQLLGEVVSASYLDLTLHTMNLLGIEARRNDTLLIIEPFSVCEDAVPFVVERDWSSAAYFIALAAVAKEAYITCNGLSINSRQPDTAILDFAAFHKISIKQTENGVQFTGKLPGHVSETYYRDYANCPDIAPTEMVANHLLKVPTSIGGISHLNLKESRRLDNIAKILTQYDSLKVHDELILESFEDHRMVMSAMVMALNRPLIIQDPNVVVKSFPEFWHQVEKLGFILEKLES